VEVAHFVARCAITFVDADGVATGVEVGWEFEFNEVLDGAAVAGAWVGFEVGG
jgi:hypothetical protein